MMHSPVAGVSYTCVRCSVYVADKTWVCVAICKLQSPVAVVRVCVYVAVCMLQCVCCSVYVANKM